MFQCEHHPYKICTFYDSSSQLLQCSQCVIPPELAESQEGLIDIERLTYMATSMLQSQPFPKNRAHNELETLWSKVEDMIFESQEQAHQQIDRYYVILKEQATTSFELLRKEVEIHKGDLQRHTQSGKELQSLLENISHQPALPQYIENLKELNDALSAIQRCDPMTSTFTQRFSDMQTKFLNQLETQLKAINNNFSSAPAIVIKFESVDEPRYQEGFRSQAVSKRSTMSNLSKRVFRETITQIAKKELRCSLPTEFNLTCLTTCLNLVVVGTIEGTLVVFDNESWEELQRLQCHNQSLKVLCCQAGEQNYVASGSSDANIKVFKRCFNDDLAQFYLAEHVTLRGHHGPVLDLLMVDVLKGQNLLSCSADNTVRVWDYVNGTALMCYSGHQMDVNCIAYSKSLNMICSGSKDKSIRVWNGMEFKVCKPQAKMTGHTDAVMGATILEEDQKTLLSTSLDKTIRLWDIAKGTMIRSFLSGVFMSRVVYYQPGLVMVLGFQKQIDVWDYNISTRVHNMSTTSKVGAFAIESGKVYTVEGKSINQYY